METLRKNNLVVGILCALCCEIIYGMSYIFTKQATKVTSGFALLGWRFLIAFVIMTFLVLLGIVKVNLKEKSLKPIFIVAVFSPGIYFIGETVGISHTTASESGILLACIPIASLVGSTVILREKPGKWQIVGIFITLMGVITTVIAVGASSSFSPTGYLFLFIAVISYALYSVFVERAKGYTGAEITYMMLVVGAIIFVISACIDGYGRSNIKELICLPLQSTEFLIAILYQGIGCSILAFFLSNVAISEIGVNRTASFIGVATVVSIFSGKLLLREKLSLHQIIGAGIILCGVYIANIKIAKK